MMQPLWDKLAWVGLNVASVGYLATDARFSVMSVLEHEGMIVLKAVLVLSLIALNVVKGLAAYQAWTKGRRDRGHMDQGTDTN